MTDPNSNRGAAIVRGWALCLLGLSTPVVWTAARGGADWHPAAAFHVSWFDLHPAAPIAMASLVIASISVRTVGWGGRALIAALLAWSVATAILWLGGGRIGFLSLRHPDASFWVGAGALLVAWLCGAFVERAPGGSRRALAVGLALLAGISLQLAIARLDAARLASALSDSSSASPSVERAAAAGGSPNLVWIVVDTLRADALGEGRRSPHLDRLAGRAAVFTRTAATAPWTLPSMMSLMSSRLPSSLDPVARGRAERVERLPTLSGEIGTWIDSLREAGYYTVGFQKNPFLAPGFGFDLRFDLYRMVGGARAEAESARQLGDAALRWADAHARQALESEVPPVLLYLHFMDPHIDYRAPRAWWSPEARAYRGDLDGGAASLHRRLEAGDPLSDSDRDQLRRLYEAEVAYLDAEVGRVLAGLEQRGVVDDETWIVLSSDHGEQLGEHGGWEHGDLHPENVYVPWLVAGPGVAPRRIEEPVSTLDLGPTLLELLGLPPLAGAEGRSRARWIVGEERTASGASRLPEPIWTEYGQRLRLAQGPWVLVLDGVGGSALFDTRADPTESVDRSEVEPARAEAMRRLARAHLEDRFDPRRDAVPAREAPGIEPRWREALEELGYLWDDLD